MPQSPLERLKLDEWDRMIDVNIKGVLYGIAAALPFMKSKKPAISSMFLLWPGIRLGLASRSVRQRSMRWERTHNDNMVERRTAQDRSDR
jgi:NAD(P)-dependent dehydrogenase (short-subunit alcohol dehydrogenase family)